jgi:hypothetical protein
LAAILPKFRQNALRAKKAWEIRMMDADLLDRRVAELEEYARRVIPARSGEDGWVNYIQSCLLEERKFSHEIIAHALALFRDEILTACKTVITEALIQRIRGTFDSKTKYVCNDIVACDGASFIAKRDDPGCCPGAGWQLLARQGARGKTGDTGLPGKDAPRIVSWVVDRATYSVTPLLAGGGPPGPTLELRVLFEQSEDERINRSTAPIEKFPNHDEAVGGGNERPRA